MNVSLRRRIVISFFYLKKKHNRKIRNLEHWRHRIALVFSLGFFTIHIHVICHGITISIES